MNMPELTGIEVVQKVRELEKTQSDKFNRKLPVFIESGDDGNKLKMKA